MTLRYYENKIKKYLGLSIVSRCGYYYLDDDFRFKRTRFKLGNNMMK